MRTLHSVSRSNAVESSGMNTEAARTTSLRGTGKQPLNAFPRNERWEERPMQLFYRVLQITRSKHLMCKGAQYYNDYIDYHEVCDI